MDFYDFAGRAAPKRADFPSVSVVNMWDSFLSFLTDFFADGLSFPPGVDQVSGELFLTSSVTDAAGSVGIPARPRWVDRLK